MKKEHKKKNYQYQFKHRNEAKYKILSKMTNIFQTKKIFLMRKEKWSYIQYFTKRCKSRKIFNFPASYHIVAPRLSLRVTRFRSTSYKYALSTKRRFQAFFGVKKFSLLKKIYHQTTFLKFKRYYLYFKTIINLFITFENRVDTLLMRSFFFSSVHTCRDFIQAGHVSINTKIVTNFNTVTRINDVIEIVSHRSLIFDYFKNLKKKKELKFKRLLPLLNYPHFEVNFHILTIFRYDFLLTLDSLRIFYPFIMKDKILNSFLKQKS